MKQKPLVTIMFNGPLGSGKSKLSMMVEIWLINQGYEIKPHLIDDDTLIVDVKGNKNAPR